MTSTKSIARRAALATAAAVLAVGLPTAGSAMADPAPNCTPADMAGVASGVAASASAYLFTHPDVNEFYAGLRGKPRDEMAKEVRAYFDANPQTHAELKGIRQPLVDFRSRCGLSEPEQPMMDN